MNKIYLLLILMVLMLIGCGDYESSSSSLVASLNAVGYDNLTQPCEDEVHTYISGDDIMIGLSGCNIIEFNFFAANLFDNYDVKYHKDSKLLASSYQEFTSNAKCDENSVSMKFIASRSIDGVFFRNIEVLLCDGELLIVL